MRLGEALGETEAEELDSEEDEREEEHHDVLRFGFPCLTSTGKDHPGRIQLDGGNLLLRLATETYVIAPVLKIPETLQGTPVELEIAVPKICRMSVDL